MDLRQLNYFVQTCRFRSFSKAAEYIHVTQQAISKATRNLEDELGVMLVHRSPGGITPTSYGKVLLDRAKVILCESDNAIQEIQRLSAQHAATVSVGFTFGAISTLTYEYVFRFRDLYPNIKLLIQESSDKYCEDSLEKGQIHMACVVAPTDSRRFTSVEILSEPVYLLASSENPLSHKKSPVTMEDLRNQSFLQVTEDFHAPMEFERVCRSAGFVPNTVFRSSEALLLQEMAQQNYGLYLVPAHITNTMSLKNTIAFPFPDNRHTWDLCLITRKDEPLSEPVRIFHDYLQRARTSGQMPGAPAPERRPPGAKKSRA